MSTLLGPVDASARDPGSAARHARSTAWPSSTRSCMNVTRSARDSSVSWSMFPSYMSTQYPGRCSVFPMTARPLHSRPIRVGLVRCRAGADRLPASKTKWQIDLRTLHLFGGGITDRGLFDYSACCCSVRRTR